MLQRLTSVVRLPAVFAVPISLLSVSLCTAAAGAPAENLPAGMGVAEEWGHFLGPNYDGVPPVKHFEPKGLTQVWTRELGPGCSSVTLAAGKLFTMGNRNDRDIVYCLDPKSGRETWTFDYACPRMPNLYEGGPNSTPTIADGRVYTLSRKGHVHCLEAKAGSRIWEASCAKWTPKGGWWGFSGSPVVWGDKVFVNASGKGVALKRESGEIVWSGSRSVPAYGTILPLPQGNPVTGKPALVVQTSRNVDIVVPDTGESLLGAPPAWATYVSNDNGVAPKAYEGGLLLMHGSKGLSKVSRKDGAWTEEWLCSELVYDKGNWFTFNRQVVRGTFLYAIAGNAKGKNTRLACVDLETGRVAWSQPHTFGNLLLASDRLMIVTQDGEIAWGVLSGSEYRETFRKKLLNGGKGQGRDGYYWAHPVLHDGHLFVRSTKGKLTCFRVEQ